MLLTWNVLLRGHFNAFVSIVETTDISIPAAACLVKLIAAVLSATHNSIKVNHDAFRFEFQLLWRRIPRSQTPRQ
jgi:hypothetical protein